MNTTILLCFAISFIAITHGSKIEDLLKELKRKTLEKRQEPKQPEEACDATAAFVKCHEKANMKLPDQTEYDLSNAASLAKYQKEIMRINDPVTMLTFGKCWQEECPVDSSDEEPEGCDSDQTFYECQKQAKLTLPSLSKYDWENEKAEDQFFCDIVKKNGKGKMDNFKKCWMSKCPGETELNLPKCQNQAPGNKQDQSLLLKKLLQLIDSA